MQSINEFYRKRAALDARKERVVIGAASDDLANTLSDVLAQTQAQAAQLAQAYAPLATPVIQPIAAETAKAAAPALKDAGASFGEGAGEGFRSETSKTLGLVAAVTAGGYVLLRIVRAVTR